MFGRGRGRGAPANDSDQQNTTQPRQNDYDSSNTRNTNPSGFGGGFGRGASSNFQRDTDRQNEGGFGSNRGGFGSNRGSSMRGGPPRNDYNNDDQQNRGNFSQRGRGFGRDNGGASRNNYDDGDDCEQRNNSGQRGRGGASNFDDNDPPRQSGRGGFGGRNDDNNDFDQRPTRGNISQRGRGRSDFNADDDGNGFGQQSTRGNYGGRGRSAFNADDGGNDFGQQSTRGNYGGRGRGGFNADDDGNGFGQQSTRGNYGGRGRGGFNADDDGNGFGQQSTRGNYGGRGRGGFNADDDSNRDFGGRGRGGLSRGGFGERNGDDGFSSRRGGFNSGAGGDRACYNCGQGGHMSRDCPEPRQPRDGQRGMQSDFSDRQPYGNRGGFGGGGGSFQPRFDENEVRRPPSNFVPRIRDVEEIYKDDENVDAANDEFYQQDMEVTVENGPEDLAIFETWEESGLMPQLLENISRSRYSKPRLFQRYTIPLVLEGNDVKGQAETGSGKSAAFLLPIINALAQSFSENPDDTRRLKVSALIIEPTRELAKQLYEQGIKFAHKTGVTVNFAYGEYNMGVNKKSLHEKGCDILVGTPGRLKGLLKDNFLKVETLQFLVLDEADRLLDFNFMDDIVEMTRVPGFSPTDQRQTLFFSATFSPDASRYANELCKKNSVLVRNTKTGVSLRVEQQFLHVPINERKECLIKLLKDEMAANNGVLPKKLVFVETKRDADYIATLLSDEGIKAQTVNGDRPQDLREEATEGFRKGNYLVLVVTNVFARGMNFTDLGQVINMYLPTDRDTYIHRIGRTGRRDTGIATSFFDPEHQTDRDLAPVLIEELERSGHEVPDFIRAATTSSIFGYGGRQQNGGYGYEQSSRGGGYDQSRNDGQTDISAPEF